jgi:hypothetical protein
MDSMHQKNSTPEDSTVALKPFAVSIKTALELLGGKSRSQFYVDVGAGKLDVIKDGNKTLVILESIERYIASLPRAQIGRSRAVA